MMNNYTKQYVRFRGTKATLLTGNIDRTPTFLEVFKKIDLELP